MHDDASKTHQELIQENSSLKRRIQELESLAAALERAEKGRRDNEERNQLLLSNTTDYVAHYNMRGELLFASEAMRSMLGYDPAEVIGTSGFDRIHPDDGPHVREALKKIAAIEPGAVSKVEYRAICRDGSCKWVEMSGKTFLSNQTGELEIIASVRDIAERKQAEDALRASDVRFNKLSSHVSGMIYQFMKRPDGSYCVPFTTAAIEDVYGCSPEDVREDFTPIARALWPEDVENIIASIEYSAAHMTPWQCEYRVQVPGRTVRWMIGQSTPEKMADGSIIWHGFITDITDLKTVQEESERRAAVTAAINRIHQSALKAGTDVDVALICLREAEALTGSPFGWVGEINPAGKMDTLALSDPGWKSCGIHESGQAIKDMELRGIFGHALKNAESLLTNDPGNHPERVGLPQGHPPLTAFLGVPLLVGGRSIGMVALGNKTGGYTSHDQEAIEALSVAFVEALHRKREALALLQYKALLDRAGRMVRFGGWSMRTIDNKVVWSDQVADIHEVPPGFSPTLEDCINFYAQGSREIIIKVFGDCAQNGVPYDEELEIVTARGNCIWIRTLGEAVRDAAGAIIAVEGAFQDINDRKKAEVELKKTLKNLRKALGTIIQVLVSAVETRDPYTAGHQVRTADLARSIAMELKLSGEQVEGIRMAGSIHDIGKLSVPAEILSKPTKLTDIEYALIKEHPRRGYELLRDVESPWPLAQIVLQHHERLDGSGYPEGRKGDEIILEARIMAVADVVEAMASHRPYRPGLGLKAALEEISRNRSRLYDAAVVDACLSLFHERNYQFI